MKQNEETYRQILKQMYQAERNAQQYDWYVKHGRKLN
jgi:hypothetical protein